MKIRCDVCAKDEAAVFCTADEAALCGGCDHRVHHANKLASKHQRFSLLSPSSKDLPVCDICQERRAFLFCQEDRAILCKECDVPIHTANEHTQKHSRFFLTGVKLSTTPSLYTSTAAQPHSCNGVSMVRDFKLAETSSAKKLPAPGSASSAAIPTSYKEGSNSSSNSLSMAVHHGKGSTSSISEYLIDMLPGWHFEEFIDTCSDSFGFYKSVGNTNDYGSLFSTEDGDDSLGSSFLSSESLGTLVPQAPTLTISAANTNYQISGETYRVKEAAAISRQTVTAKHNSTNNKRSTDDILAVPQIRPPPSGLKRSRLF
ncbi:hypothetical protein SAY86_006438 [Trapa natans]|uniref:B box-type domain-containing protein n=1 Tax=Trapa natans TaxID=22666 RepID=A0AAN7QWS3_TRANT|nr:hypothetical protein SAY86_006438 [Trapa natans]